MRFLDVIFFVLLFLSLLTIGFLISLPVAPLLEGKYNSKTLTQAAIFIPAAIIAYVHLYKAYRKSDKVSKNMIYTVLGYIIIFPIVFAIVVMVTAVVS